MQKVERREVKSGGYINKSDDTDFIYVCRYILLTDYTASWQEKQKNVEGEQKEELISMN